MNKLILGVGIGMLVLPFVIGGLILGTIQLISLGIGALFGICFLAYIGTALFLIIKGCVDREY